MNNLIEFLPERYRNITEIHDFEAALQIITDMAANARDELLLQLNVQTATWGLDLWEKQYGLDTDVNKDYKFRRTRLMSRMRGTGTTTVEMIKNVAESFINGNVKITEHNSEYYFDVEMVDKIGIPPNFDDLKAALEEIKPAHIAICWIIKYVTHKQLSAYTHAQMMAYTNKQLREEVIS
ncbi:MAG: YmfQ family protein [Clostridia bacterium]|nr:YmfQ family protein [Clostridia bacterium]